MHQNDNVLIHVFMGWEQHPGFVDTMQVAGIEQGFRKLSDFCLKQEIDYDKSWNSLMPVVKKISEFQDINKYKESEGWLAYWGLESALFEVDIERVYKLVVEFINWYNENQDR